MRTIRAKFRGCDIRFDCFVYLGNFLSFPQKAARAQGRNGAGAEATAASFCAIRAIMAFRAERQQMKSRSSALSALVCSLGPGPGFASDTANGQDFDIGLFGGAGTASSMSARQEGGFYLPGP